MILCKINISTLDRSIGNSYFLFLHALQ
jgi:hypothetical protein